jgi:hypothetical protein
MNLWLGLAVVFIIVVIIVFWRYPDTVASICSLDCSSPSVLNRIKNYYDTIGPFKGSYRINPVNSVKVNVDQCDVQYEHVPIGKETGLTPSNDKRRFTLKADNSCDWSVKEMGPHNSGIWAV